MKVLIVSQYFWPETFIVNGLVSELIQRGHHVEILTGLPNYPSGALNNGYSLLSGPWTESFEGAKVHRAFLLPRGKGFLRLSFNYVSFVLGACLKALFLKKDYDVIFCYAPSPVTTCFPAIFVRWLTKKPLVFWVQDLWPESISAIGAIKSERIIRIIGKMVRFIYRRCDIILVQSRAFKQSILKWGGDEKKIRYVPNWAEPFIENDIIPEWVTNLPDGFKIGFAGNIGKAQDMTTMIEAAEILKENIDIKWIIAGDGSEKQWLDAEIKNRNLQNIVYTVGKKPYNEMLPFFKACDILYVSLTDEYIFSLTIPAKVQAYMSASKPILAALDGEGVRIINEAQVGFSAASGNPRELANCVLLLKEMSVEQRQQMGKNGLKYFKENFDRSLVVNHIEDILKKSLEE